MTTGTVMVIPPDERPKFTFLKNTIDCDFRARNAKTGDGALLIAAGK